MPQKALAQKLRNSDPVKSVSIPTTIKNPERVAFRRSELINVATQMFLERGFHNTSIRDIVRACSFNVASLYMYVSSKEDILFLVAQELMSTIATELSETKLDPKSARRSLEMGFAGYCDISNKFRRQIRLLYREVGFLPQKPRTQVLATVEDVVGFFEKIVENGIATGEFRQVTPRLVALNVMMIAHTLALHTREVLSITDIDSYVRSHIETLFAGILAETKAGTKQRKSGTSRS
jgi:AcrR family transcriptional regulator